MQRRLAVRVRAVPLSARRSRRNERLCWSRNRYLRTVRFSRAAAHDLPARAKGQAGGQSKSVAGVGLVRGELCRLRARHRRQAGAA
jgi:hypothetical protein